MKKFAILLPALVVAGIALAIPRHQDAPQPENAPSNAVILHPDTESGDDITLEFHGGPKTDAYSGHPTSGEWRGRFRYQKELGGVYLYLYDGAGHLINRVHDPEWVKVVKDQVK